MKTKIRRSRNYKVTDLRQSDLDLLYTAYALPEDVSLCFGQSYFILKSLDLITEECKISWYGKKLIKSMAV